MKRKRNISILHLAGDKSHDLDDADCEFYNRFEGMTHLNLAGIDPETGEISGSFCVWLATEVADKIIIRDCKIPEQSSQESPVAKVKTNVTEMQPYREEKELMELSRKLMAILFDR